MSFRCQLCGKAQPTYAKPVNLVIETRSKVYPKRYADPQCKILIDAGGVGTEIVREVEACEECANGN